MQVPEVACAERTRRVAPLMASLSMRTRSSTFARLRRRLGWCRRLHERRPDGHRHELRRQRVDALRHSAGRRQGRGRAAWPGGLHLPGDRPPRPVAKYIHGIPYGQICASQANAGEYCCTSETTCELRVQPGGDLSRRRRRRARHAHRLSVLGPNRPEVNNARSPAATVSERVTGSTTAVIRSRDRSAARRRKAPWAARAA